MLKHTSNAGGATGGSVVVTVNGQQQHLLRTCSRNNNNNSSSSSSSSHKNSSSSNKNNNPPSTVLTSTTTTSSSSSSNNNNPAATPALTAVVVVPATSTSTSPTPAAVATTARNIHLRPPQPLNVSSLVAATGTAAAATATPPAATTARAAKTLLNIATPPIKPSTPLTPNGNSLHHHTYTNQHMLASSSSTSSNNQQQQQQQQQQHLQLQQQQLQQQQHHHQHCNNNNKNHVHHHNMNNNTNNNNANNYSHCNNLNLNSMLQPSAKLTKHGPGPREVLTSLGLLCLVSLLLALLSLIFLLKISPNSRDDALTRSIGSEDFNIVYDVTLALCALSLSLNLCCLLVCAIQFLFAVKLLRSPMFDGRDNKYLEKSSVSRTCAVSGFFISIPVFLTAIILYTFNHFHSTPAIITSVLIGVGIVFCGGAMVHNVFVWQKEKTISYRSPPNMSLQLPPPVPFLNQSNYGQIRQHHSQSVQQHHQPTSLTPVSPNHSQGSFNPLLSNSNTNVVNSPYFICRPATPPTPKPLAIPIPSCLIGHEASGSVSPGIPTTLDMSNITNISLHELSTLV
ncbi:hypothetical protein ACLKA7_005873 [Drosophila subpalustris]